MLSSLTVINTTIHKYTNRIIKIIINTTINTMTKECTMTIINHWLVGNFPAGKGIPVPLKNMTSSVGVIIPNICLTILKNMKVGWYDDCSIYDGQNHPFMFQIHVPNHQSEIV
jgi:hypothetical protein